MGGGGGLEMEACSGTRSPHGSAACMGEAIGHEMTAMYCVCTDLRDYVPICVIIITNHVL